MSTYTQTPGADTGEKYFQDVEISPVTLANGELGERFDTKKYPQVGIKTTVALASFTLAVTEVAGTLTLTATATATAAPNPLGSVEFYEGATFLGRAPLRAADDSLDTIAAATVATAVMTGVEGAIAGNITAQYDGQAADVTSSAVAVTAPAITSLNHKEFTNGSAGTFTVTTTGSPAPSLSVAGTLPTGITFVDNNNGTATLAGTPTSAGAVVLTLTADNGVDPNATQSFTLTVAGVVTVASSTPNTVARSTTGDVTIAGTGFATGAVTTVSGAGVTVNSTTFLSATSLTVNVTVTGAAALTARDVTVTNTDTGSGVGVGILTVTT